MSPAMGVSRWSSCRRTAADSWPHTRVDGGLAVAGGRVFGAVRPVVRSGVERRSVQHIDERDRLVRRLTLTLTGEPSVLQGAP